MTKKGVGGFLLALALVNVAFGDPKPTATELYDLRSKCKSDATKLYHEQSDGVNEEKGSPVTVWGYESYYNSDLNRCFAVMRLVINSSATGTILQARLLDAQTGSQIAVVNGVGLGTAIWDVPEFSKYVHRDY